MRKTKIICTIGPATDSLDAMKKLIHAGMNVARLNFSHGTHDQHGERIHKLRQAVAETRTILAIMLDTKGPEIRTGCIKGGKIILRQGARIILTTDDVEGNEERISVSYTGLPQAVRPGSTILISDGKLSLSVVKVGESEVECEVVAGGELTNQKGVNLPGTIVDLPSLTEKDVADINFGIDQKVDLIAASFTRCAEDILAIRRILEQRAADIHIIAKIENEQGVQNLDEIIRVADGVMVARGDLGVEIPAEEVPLIQKEIIKKCNRAGKPVVTATQMLESMLHNPRPTRAEASDVANAILDGTDAVMLSGETAAGSYPVEAVQVMSRIAERTEQSLSPDDLLQRRVLATTRTTTDAISYATCTIAENLGVAAIIVATESGLTARMVSKYRPLVPVLAVCPDESVCRKLSLVWGVRQLHGLHMSSAEKTIQEAVARCIQEGGIRCGDMVVITSGVPTGIAGTTNLLKIHVVGTVLASGTGIGDHAAIGRIRICSNAEDAITKIEAGDILVVTSTDNEFMQAIHQAGAIITEDGGLTSHAAIVGLNLHIPVVVGIKDAAKILVDGDVVTVDSVRGLIYQGVTTVL